MSKALILIFLVFTGFLFSQEEAEDTLVERLQVYDGFDLPSNFKEQYRVTLRKVRRVYPLALEAARVIDSLDRELESINKNRLQKKLMRKTHASLKSEDRKSTRLNSSHVRISYAVFCLKKKIMI